MKNPVLYFLVSMVQSLAVGVATGAATVFGAVILEVVFGGHVFCQNNFEGRCGYAVLGIAIYAGILAAIVFFIFKIKKFSSVPATAPTPAAPTSPPSTAPTAARTAAPTGAPALDKVWWVALASVIGVNFGINTFLYLFLGPGVLIFVTSLMAGAFLAWASAPEFKKVNWHPLWGAVALLPWNLGWLAVIVLLVIARQTRA